MLQAATQMDALIQDLLDSTRLEAGRLRLVPQWTGAAELVSAAVEKPRHRYPIAPETRSLISLARDFPPQTCPTYMRIPERIAQMLPGILISGRTL